MSRKKLLVLLMGVVLLFGGFFAYNVHGYVITRQQTLEAQEDSAQILTIFDAWLANELPPAPIITEPAEMEEEVVEPVRIINEHQEYTGVLTPQDEFIEPFVPPPCFPTLLQTFRTETRNPDIIAFINIPGTNIQYAVVQGRDNEFYLNHSLFRRPNMSGAVFMDYRNNRNFNDPNTILYGHHLRNGMKFTELRNFRNRAFFNENRYIQIFTNDGLIEYEIFAAFTTHIYFYYIQVDFAEGEFAELISELLRRSYHNARIRVRPNDRLLVLSTCTAVHDDERMVVVGRRL